MIQMTMISFTADSSDLITVYGKPDSKRHDRQMEPMWPPDSNQVILLSHISDLFTRFNWFDNPIKFTLLSRICGFLLLQSICCARGKRGTVRHLWYTSDDTNLECGGSVWFLNWPQCVKSNLGVADLKRHEKCSGVPAENTTDTLTFCRKRLLKSCLITVIRFKALGNRSK